MLGNAARAIVYRLTNLFWWLVRNAIALIAIVFGFNALNRLYLAVPSNWYPLLHSRLWNVFSRAKVSIPQDVTWKLEFLNVEIKLPIQQDRLSLDWQHALALLGHDAEVKWLYIRLLENKKVDWFLDIGANYGTHSLLFLTHGIKTISFEPNPICSPVFGELCKQNGVQGDWREVALFEDVRDSELQFTEHEPWLGRLRSSRVSDQEKTIEITTETLDRVLLQETLIGNGLIKIDVEGCELNVLKGGESTIRRLRPVVQFECHESSTDCQLVFEFFNAIQYFVFPLTKVGLGEQIEKSVPATSNYVALPELKPEWLA